MEKNCEKPDALPVVADAFKPYRLANEYCEQHCVEESSPSHPIALTAFVAGYTYREAELSELQAERDTLQAELAAMREQKPINIECRQCDECYHTGINDMADGNSACSHCKWHGPNPDADKCPECRSEGTMSASCPECGCRYRLLADSAVAAPLYSAPLSAPGHVAAEVVQVPRDLADELLAELSPKNPVSKALRALLATSQGEA